MSNKIKCPLCGKDVVPESFSGKDFCPECGNEIVVSAPVEAVAPESTPSPAAEGSAAVIRDGMGIIENSRNKVGAVESFSDNSVTNHTTNNTTNITNISDDTKKSVVCEISGKKVLVTSSVQCPVCGKTVSTQYYDEEKLRCVECEKRAVAQYEKHYLEFAKDARVIDKDIREVLDGKAKALKLTQLQVKEIELRLRKVHSGKEAHLSEIKQKDFDRSIAQMYDEKVTPDVIFEKIAAYAKVTDDDAVQCWYHVIWAAYKEKQYISELENATVDNYWQQYWAFVAYAGAGNIAAAVDAVDTLRNKYPEKINDVILAQTYLGVFQYMDSEDDSYLFDSDHYFESISGPDSECLKVHYDRYDELYNLFAPSDYDDFKIWQVVLTRKLTYDRHKVAATGSVLASNRPAAAKPAPAAAKPTSAPAKPAPTPVKPAPAKPAAPAAPEAAAQKGVVINNTAGGPRNPQVSFENAEQPKKKKGSFFPIIIVLAIIGFGGYFLLGGSAESEDEAAPASVQTTVTTQSVSSAPTVTTTTTTTTTVTPAPAAAPASVPAQEVVPVSKPATMAEKAAAAASEAKPAATVGTDDYSKGMAAYESGDYKTAHDLFKKAGNAGNADACYQLGMMLSTGKGSIAKNTLQAKVWLKKAAGLGHADAQTALSTM